MIAFEYDCERFQNLHGGGTSGHDLTALREILTSRGSIGWRLVDTWHLPNGISMLIFERQK